MSTLFLISSFLLISEFAISQTKVDPATINEIRKEVQQINGDAGYTVKKLSQDEFLQEGTDNGAELSGYFKDGRLVKIREWIGLSSCVNITEYYLQDGRLIFSYTKGSQSPYNEKTQTFDDGKPEVTMEYRFYFENGKLIKSILKGSSRCSGAPTNDLANTMVKECERYKQLLQK